VTSAYHVPAVQHVVELLPTAPNHEQPLLMGVVLQLKLTSTAISQKGFMLIFTFVRSTPLCSKQTAFLNS
jgi:hypothetical protein